MKNKDGGMLFLEHLSEYSKLTNDEVIKKSSESGGLDIELYFDIILERELCKGIINNLKEWKPDKN